MNSRLDTLAGRDPDREAGRLRRRDQRRARRWPSATTCAVEPLRDALHPRGLKSVWAQYTLKTTSAAERDALQEKAKAAGVPTVVYYPMPLHQQKAYRGFPRDPAGLPVSEDLAERVVSLPMHPYLAADVQDQITMPSGGPDESATSIPERTGYGIATLGAANMVK